MEILSPWRQNHGSNSHILSSKPWIKFPQHPLTVYIQLKIHTKYKRKPQIYLHLSTSHSYRNFPYFLCSHILPLHPFSFSLRSLHCSSLSHAASINFSLLSNPLQFYSLREMTHHFPLTLYLLKQNNYFKSLSTDQNVWVLDFVFNWINQLLIFTNMKNSPFVFNKAKFLNGRKESM